MSSRDGRSAPWAKVLGVLLGAVLLAAVAYFVSNNIEQNNRENAAFEATRTDARRYADAVTDRVATWPAGREQLRNILRTTAGKNGLLFQVQDTSQRTRVIALFTRHYTRPLALFGPADATADRCFAFDFPHGATTGEVQVRIDAADSDESCSDLT
ncbi:hypothetical protein [Streptomyces sp. Da 82-17]|uniref:hypothetical protein n=1 Tax=Streptomyces sp. Da 82-17 TaxID=3377116 RepID=UPI0038D4E27C